MSADPVGLEMKAHARRESPFISKNQRRVQPMSTRKRRKDQALLMVTHRGEGCDFCLSRRYKGPLDARSELSMEVSENFFLQIRSTAWRRRRRYAMDTDSTMPVGGHVFSGTPRMRENRMGRGRTWVFIVLRSCADARFSPMLIELHHRSTRNQAEAMSGLDLRSRSVRLRGAMT